MPQASRVAPAGVAVRQGSATRAALLGVALAAALAACGGGDDPPPTGSGVGTVKGLVVAQDGETPIPGAVVTLASKPANGPEDTTDATGLYELTGVPAGTQTLLAERGAFAARFTVTVRANETVTAAPAKVSSVAKLAYVPGSYDRIEDIVRDSLGHPMDELSADQLGSAAVTSQYAMIFLNCGLDVSPLLDNAAALQNLKTWVSNGGLLYASDFALDVVAAMFPEHIQSTIETGDTQSVTAAVTSPDLQKFIGKSTAQIQYDLDSWKTVDAISATPQVLLRGTFTGGGETHTNKPLAIVIPHGQGKVIFTSFHNEAGVTQDQLAVLRFFIYFQ